MYCKKPDFGQMRKHLFIMSSTTPLMEFFVQCKGNCVILLQCATFFYFMPYLSNLYSTESQWTRFKAERAQMRV